MPHEFVTDIRSDTVDTRNITPTRWPAEVLEASVPNGLEGDVWAVDWPIWSGDDESDLQPTSVQGELYWGRPDLMSVPRGPDSRHVTRDHTPGHAKTRGMAELAAAFGCRDDAVPWGAWSNVDAWDRLAAALVQTTSLDVAGDDWAGHRDGHDNAYSVEREYLVERGSGDVRRDRGM